MRLVYLLMLAPALAAAERDHHSYANPEHVLVKHLDLNLNVDFNEQFIYGRVTLTINRTSKDTAQPLILDTRDLLIQKVWISKDGTTFEQTDKFSEGKPDAVLGSSLTIPIPENAKAVKIAYVTIPKRAAALQWLNANQTASKQPLMYTQSQAIEARSWIPLQDSPAVRVTYNAVIHTSESLTAVMSAAKIEEKSKKGEHHFEMKQAIPPYLIALCVGDLKFHKLGPRTGVYAEAPVLAKAAAEFADVEEIVAACEKLYGPYRWERYDILVLPPSFPFGGMENPRLTFASPTVLAGDKSLVSLVAHELAHSWSGNLVSNATWRDFWLNEGFTVYLERRIMESVYGKERAEAERLLGKRSLDREMAALPKPDQVLHIDLKNRPPIDGLTDVPYEKGALFLTHLESVYGREKFDAFLKAYFDHFAFKSITTAEFERYLDEHLLNGDEAKAKQANVKAWLYEPGIPAGAPDLNAGALVKVELYALMFSKGDITADKLPGKSWTVQKWLAFLNALPAKMPVEKLKALDNTYSITKTGNSEVLFQWLMLSIAANYEPGLARLESFLKEQGRRKFLMPLYSELAKTPEGLKTAKAIYAQARGTYHPASIESIDAILKK